jgi:sulfur relay (sulfurtransferase) complex TusBCD TusD component (DsrE family)
MRRSFIGIGIGIGLLLAGLLAVGPLGQADSAQKSKFLVILQAAKTSPDGPARAFHAILYSQELHEQGHTVRLMFDGAATAWIEEFTNPASTHMLKPAYEKFQKLGITEIICDYCAGAYKVQSSLAGRDLPLVSEYQGHPSLAKWVEQGYQILIL